MDQQNSTAEAFVYIWYNSTDTKKYIGYHKGTRDDGYVCSSLNDLFWSDFNNPEKKWHRRIVFWGNIEECKRHEYEILCSVDINCDSNYNLGCFPYFAMTDAVREKISAAQRGADNHQFGKTGKNSPSFGIVRSDETIEKMRTALSGENHPNFGKKLSQKTRAKISQSRSGKNHPNFGKRGKANVNFGSKRSEETKEKMRAAMKLHWEKRRANDNTNQCTVFF